MQQPAHQTDLAIQRSKRRRRSVFSSSPFCIFSWGCFPAYFHVRPAHRNRSYTSLRHLESSTEEFWLGGAGHQPMATSNLMYDGDDSSLPESHAYSVAERKLPSVFLYSHPYVRFLNRFCTHFPMGILEINHKNTFRPGGACHHPTQGEHRSTSIRSPPHRP